MNINLIKAAISTHLGIPINAMDISRQYEAITDEATGTVTKGAPLPWLSSWIETDTVRCRVVFHEEVFNKIKADATFSGLAIKKPVVVTPEGGKPYTRIVVITPEIEATF